MTAHIEFEITCDYYGRGVLDCPHEPFFSNQKSIRGARQEAQRSGWECAINGHGDYCPDHAGRRREAQHRAGGAE